MQTMYQKSWAVKPLLLVVAKICLQIKFHYIGTALSKKYEALISINLNCPHKLDVRSFLYIVMFDLSIYLCIYLYDVIYFIPHCW